MAYHSAPIPTKTWPAVLDSSDKQQFFCAFPRARHPVSKGLVMFHLSSGFVHLLLLTSVCSCAAEPQQAGVKKLTRAQKRREKEEHEEQVRQRELARVSDSASQPESAEDFERLVMGEPDNSMVWIQFMAFLVALGEVDKARGIAERALATINFR